MCGVRNGRDRARARAASFVDLEVAAGDGDDGGAASRSEQGDEVTEPAERARYCVFPIEGEDYGCRERDSESEQRRLLDQREEQYAHHDCQGNDRCDYSTHFPEHLLSTGVSRGRGASLLSRDTAS